MRIKSVYLLAAAALLLMLSNYAFASTLQVNYPSHGIEVNDSAVVESSENRKRVYPYLEYRGITYFPMTWHDAGRLNYYPAWDGDRLDLKSRDYLQEYDVMETEPFEENHVLVSPAAYDIYVNGEKLVLSSTYPPFSYRDITYIPMTWEITQQLKLGNEFVAEQKVLHITKEGYTPPPKGTYTGSDVDYEFTYNGKPLYVRLHYGPRVDGNTLSFSYDGESYKIIGSMEYFFGTKSTEEGRYIQDRDISFEDGWIYVMAARIFENEPSSRYRINIETEEMQKVD